MKNRCIYVYALLRKNGHHNLTFYSTRLEGYALVDIASDAESLFNQIRAWSHDSVYEHKGGFEFNDAGWTDWYWVTDGVGDTHTFVIYIKSV